MVVGQNIITAVVAHDNTRALPLAGIILRLLKAARPKEALKGMLGGRKWLVGHCTHGFFRHDGDHARIDFGRDRGKGIAYLLQLLQALCSPFVSFSLNGYQTSTNPQHIYQKLPHQLLLLG